MKKKYFLFRENNYFFHEENLQFCVFKLQCY